MTEFNNEDELMVGVRVRKDSGDYVYEGVIVSIFVKRDSNIKRYVVEDDRGLLFIFNAKQLKKVLK